LGSATDVALFPGGDIMLSVLQRAADRYDARPTHTCPSRNGSLATPMYRFFERFVVMWTKFIGPSRVAPGRGGTRGAQDDNSGEGGQ